MVMTILRHWAGSPQEVARKVQAAGLVHTARLVSRALGHRAPTAGAMPPWIDKIYCQVASRLCRYEDPEMPAPHDCGALAAGRDYLAQVPPSMQREFQSLLVLIEAAPYIYGPRRRRFTLLTGDEQDRALADWEQSALAPRRAGFYALKSMVMMGYWSRPATWGSIGYSVAENPGVPQQLRDHFEEIEDRQ